MSKVPVVIRKPQPPSTLSGDPSKSQNPSIPRSSPQTPAPPSSDPSRAPGTPMSPNTSTAPVRFAIRRPPSASSQSGQSTPTAASGSLVDRNQVRLGLPLVPLTLRSSLANLSAICPDNLDSLTAIARQQAKSLQDTADEALLASVDFSKRSASLKRPSTARQRRQTALLREGIAAVNANGLTTQISAAGAPILKLGEAIASVASREQGLLVPTPRAALSLLAHALTRERFPIVAISRAHAAMLSCVSPLTSAGVSVALVGEEAGVEAKAVIAAVEKHWRMPGALFLDLTTVTVAELRPLSEYCRSRGLRLCGYTPNPYYHHEDTWPLLDAAVVDFKKDLSTECGAVIAADADVVQDIIRKMEASCARLPARVLAPHALQCMAALRHAERHTRTWTSRARDLHTQVSMLALKFAGEFRLLPCRGAAVFVYVSASPLQLTRARDTVARQPEGSLVFERVLSCSDTALSTHTMDADQLRDEELPYDSEDGEIAHVFVPHPPSAATPAVESVFCWRIGIHNEKYSIQQFLDGFTAMMTALAEAKVTYPYQPIPTAPKEDSEWPTLGTETTALSMEEPRMAPLPPNEASKAENLRRLRFK